MKARPSFQFYPADWLRDPGLRSCSIGARGLWIDMLSFMHEAEPYGHLRLNSRDIPLESLARMTGVPLKEFRPYLNELEATGVFSRTETGTIFSRRMVRDEELRIKRGTFGHLSLQNHAVPQRKDRAKDTIKDTLPPSIGQSIGGSPSSSSSSSDSEKKEIHVPPAVEFEKFWGLYPMRNGKRLGKLEALRKWNRLSVQDRQEVLIAVLHYAHSKTVSDGIGIKDPHRWLGNGKKDKPWEEWIEPEHVQPSNGHGRSLTCTKRVQGPGDTFLRPCGQPASPESRQTEPRCSEHLSSASKPKELSLAAH